MNWKVEKLQNGETFITSEKGNSMVPIIMSGQKHVLEPIKLSDCKVNDIVFCKVKGNFYTHIIKAINDKRGLLIGNNKGGINGWTKNVYGKVIEIL
jgi:DNA-binding protein YbaB